MLSLGMHVFSSRHSSFLPQFTNVNVKKLSLGMRVLVNGNLSSVLPCDGLRYCNFVTTKIVLSNHAENIYQTF